MVIGIRISIFDDEFNVVAEYPNVAPEICSLIRSTKEGLDACKKCDRDACERAKKMRSPHVYTCHAGINEAITPIQFNDGILGYAIFAHMLPEDNSVEAQQEIVSRCLKFGLDKNSLENAALHLKKYSNEKIMASMRLLDAISAYLQIKKLASWKNEDLARQIKMFIDKNLEYPITSEKLCKTFFISRTKLYQLSIQAYGMSINQFITKCRIDKAIEFLKSGEYNVALSARMVGYDDYNYFCKIFKKITGKSPSHFKPAP